MHRYALLAILLSQLAGLSAFCAETDADCVECAPAIEDVIEEENMAAIDVRHRELMEGDDATAFGGIVVAGDAQTIELQRERNAPEQIGHENQRTVQDGDDGEIFAAIIFGDLTGELIEPREDGLLVKEDGFEVVAHEEKAKGERRKAKGETGLRGTFNIQRSTNANHQIPNPEIPKS